MFARKRWLRSKTLAVPDRMAKKMEAGVVWMTKKSLQEQVSRGTAVVPISKISMVAEVVWRNKQSLREQDGGGEGQQWCRRTKVRIW